MTRRENRQRYYNNKNWKMMSLLFRSTHPVCEKCHERPSEQVHHLKSPFDRHISKEEAMRRLLDWNNLQALCRDCHLAIHKEQEEKKKEQREKERKGQIYYIRY